MLNEYSFSEVLLYIGSYKAIDCKLFLTVETYDDDEYCLTPEDPDDYIDGAKIYGKFYFESSPIGILDKHPCKVGATGSILITGDLPTEFPIFITKKGDKIDVEKDGKERKICRYYWEFISVGQPKTDKLELFPPNYTGVKEEIKLKNRLYTCVNFRGFHSRGVSSIVIAPNKGLAREKLEKTLAEKGLLEDGVYLELEEVSLHQEQAIILQDGE